VFEEDAGVFYREESGGASGFAGGGVDDTELKPDGFGVNCDRGVDDRVNFFAAAENVDDVDGIGDVFEARIAFLTEHFPFVGIDGNDAVADRLEVGGNFVAGAGSIGRETDNSDGFCEAEKIENGIGRGWVVVGEINFHFSSMGNGVKWLWQQEGRSFKL